MTELTFATMADHLDTEIGVSPWHEITQEAVNQFAECTGDTQWIHIDVERAKAESPFGGPVMHGYMTLSLVAGLSINLGIRPRDTAASVNYGLDKVRFPAPVLVGARVRLRVKLVGFDARPDGSYMMRVQHTIEIEGGDKPACIAEAIAMLVPEAAA